MIINYFIELGEIKNFVTTAVELCYDDGVYRPYLKEFAINYAILKYYTDCPLSDFKITEVYEKMYTEWEDEIRSVYEISSQLRHLTEAVDRELEFRFQKDIRRTELSKMIDGIVGTLTQVIENPELIDLIINRLSTEEDSNGEEKEHI